MNRQLAVRDQSYDRQKAVAYARKYALKHNPRYYSFSGVGGDCANFASQCIFAGGGVMNHKPLYGWYYNNAKDRTPSWSGVKYLYNFLVGNSEAGPFATEAALEDMQPGDIIQLAISLPEFHHTLVVSEIGETPTYEDTLICCHTYDSLDRSLSTYQISRIRFLHIEGVRKYSTL